MSRPPTRFRAAEERGARLGRWVRIAGRVKELDEPLMAEIGRGFTEIDEYGAALARAMHLPEGDPERVTRAQFGQAVAGGLKAVEDVPVALKEFFDRVESTPDWVDWDRIERGAAVSRALGQNAADVLLQLSLIGGYRFGGPPDLLVATGGLVGDSTLQRLAETEEWTHAVGQPGAMRPGGDGFRQTLRVRLMHAMVNDAFGPQWDRERWGEPINQADQAATLGLFSGTLLLGSRALGVRVGRRDAADFMHLWRYIGWVMGVDDKWLVEGEREHYALLFHILCAQDGVTDAGRELSQALLAAHDRLYFARFARIRRRAARERLLSMLTIELGPTSMRELGLPLRPPWAPAYVLVLNTVRYRIVGRTAAGRRWLDAWGERVYQRTHTRHVGGAA